MSKQKGRFAIYPKAAVYDPQLSHEARSVLLVFADCADTKGICFPSLAFIGDALGMARRTVQRHVKDLKDRGYLVRRGTKMTPAGYRVKLWEVIFPDPKTSPSGVSRSGGADRKTPSCDVSGVSKAPPPDADKAPLATSETPPGASNAPSDGVSHIEQAHQNKPIRTNPSEQSHFTTRNNASSDDDNAFDFNNSEDVIDEVGYGFEGFDEGET